MRCFLESVTHRGRGRGETSLIHTDLQAVSGTHKKRTGKKAGHISQAPENVRVILGLVLLIDEWGVFKLLPLYVHVLVVTVHGKQLNAFGSLSFRKTLYSNILAQPGIKGCTQKANLSAVF